MANKNLTRIAAANETLSVQYNNGSYVAHISSGEEGGYVIGFHKANESMPAHENRHAATLDEVQRAIPCADWRTVRGEDANAE